MGKRKFLMLLPCHFPVREQGEVRVILLALLKPSLTQEAPEWWVQFCVFLLQICFCTFLLQVTNRNLPGSSNYTKRYQHSFHVQQREQLEMRRKLPIFIYFIGNVILVLAGFYFREMLGRLIFCTLGETIWMESGYPFQLRALQKKGFQVTLKP